MAAPKTLPAEQQSAIELAFFAGLTHDQIAQLTGIPLGTVMRRINLGLHRLHHAFQDPALSSAGTPSIQTPAA